MKCAKTHVDYLSLHNALKKRYHYFNPTFYRRMKTLPTVTNLGSVRAFELQQVDFRSCVVNRYLHKFPILNLISGKTMSA